MAVHPHQQPSADPPPERPATLLDKIRAHAARHALPDGLAIVEGCTGLSTSYRDLLEDIRTLSAGIAASAIDHVRLEARPVLNLLPPGYPWVLTQLALWSLHAISVPQALTQAHRELAHVIRTASIQIAVCFEDGVQKLADFGLHLIIILSRDGTRVLRTDLPLRNANAVSCSKTEAPKTSTTEEPANVAEEGALMLFTSGTTGQPKGVLSTHAAIAQQCLSMGSAWEWESKDRILHCLPLTHIHGIINALVVPLWWGATIEFLGTPVSPPSIWTRILDETLRPITIFMAVPTIYNRLANFIQADNGQMIQSSYPNAESAAAQADVLRRACTKLRLMVSGSAPLSSAIKDRWATLTGHTLLERYGMTETGMILSCPLRPISARLDGHVGLPLPGVTVRLRENESGQIIGDDERDRPGEIEVSGLSVFTGYWGDPKWAGDYFTSDRYFCTGDIAVRSGPNGDYRLLGRSSTDIIKSGGEKISALELERVISSLDGVADVSVVALPNEDWGQVVGCVMVLGPASSEKDLSDVKGLRDALRSELAPFKLPKELKIYENEIPRNAMGKVQKVQLAKVAFPECFG